MDHRLVAWARAVKARRRGPRALDLPPLWLFSDPARMPDLLGAVAALPAGLCGVVFRHDGVPDRGPAAPCGAPVPGAAARRWWWRATAACPPGRDGICAAGAAGEPVARR